jgi:hypothetical protein
MRRDRELCSKFLCRMPFNQRVNQAPVLSRVLLSRSSVWWIAEPPRTEPIWPFSLAFPHPRVDPIVAPRGARRRSPADSRYHRWYRDFAQSSHSRTEIKSRERIPPDSITLSVLDPTSGSYSSSLRFIFLFFIDAPTVHSLPCLLCPVLQARIPSYVPPPPRSARKLRPTPLRVDRPTDRRLYVWTDRPTCPVYCDPRASRSPAAKVPSPTLSTL